MMTTTLDRLRGLCLGAMAEAYSPISRIPP